MDNLGDWLYIILIAIAGISGLFSSNKKKRQQREMREQQQRDIIVTPETASDKDFWEVYPEYEPEKPIVIKPAKRNKSQSTASPPPLPFLKGESEIERIIRQQEGSPLLAVEEETKPLISSEDLHDSDALRKAVIYSEILNRKY